MPTKLTEGEKLAEKIMLDAYHANGRIKLDALPECCRHILLAYGTFGSYHFDGEKENVRGYYLDENGVRFCSEGCFTTGRKERKWINIRSWIGSVVGVLGLIIGVISLYKSCNNELIDHHPNAIKANNAIPPNTDVSIIIKDSAKSPNRKPQNIECSTKNIKSSEPITKTAANEIDTNKSMSIKLSD